MTPMDVYRCLHVNTTYAIHSYMYKQSGKQKRDKNQNYGIINISYCGSVNTSKRTVPESAVFEHFEADKILNRLQLLITANYYLNLIMWAGLIVFTLLTCLSCLVHAKHTKSDEVSCKDENGKAVDWYGFVLCVCLDG